MVDPRGPAKVRHKLAYIIRLPVTMIAAGHEDGNDAASLRHDPGFRIALERGSETGAALRSQPTISRMENQPDARAPIAMRPEMVRFCCPAFPCAPGRIVPDSDGTFDAVHGQQQLRLPEAFLVAPRPVRHAAPAPRPTRGHHRREKDPHHRDAAGVLCPARAVTLAFQCPRPAKTRLTPSAPHTLKPQPT
jgi:hypothetical protein